MANWWDTMGTQIGDSLIGMQMPFGMAPPTDPQQRAALINPMLLQIGAGMLAGKDRNPAVNLGRGILGAQQTGFDNMGRMLYAKQIMQSDEERKAEKERENRTRQVFQQNYPELYAKFGGDSLDNKQMFELMAGANKPTDHSAAYQQFQEAQANPQFAQFLERGKDGGKARTSKTSIAGRDVLLNLDTGEVIQDYGPSETRQQTVPQAVQADAIRTEQAFSNITEALDRFQGLAKNAGVWGATIPGKQRDALDQERRNIQLQLKELFNLGVLNGPDLSLMEQMIFDPGLSALEPFGSASKLIGGTDERVESSVSKLKDMLKSIRDNKMSVVKSFGGSNPTMGAISPPPDVDPALWGAMTPEEQALWQNSQ